MPAQLGVGPGVHPALEHVSLCLQSLWPRWPGCSYTLCVCLRYAVCKETDSHRHAGGSGILQGRNVLTDRK